LSSDDSLEKTSLDENSSEDSSESTWVKPYEDSLGKTRERLSLDDSWEKTSLVENSSEDSSESMWERLSEYSLEKKWEKSLGCG
jgi:hypothetical protein